MEGIHATQNQFFCFLIMADSTIRIKRIQLDDAFLRELFTYRLHAVARCAALYTRFKHILMAGHTACMHGIGQIGWNTLFGLLLCGSAGFMTVGTILRLVFNIGVTVVTVDALQPKFLVMFVMSPFFGAGFGMVTGCA